MTKELEKRLASLEKQLDTVTSVKRKKRMVNIKKLIAIAVLLLSGCIAFLVSTHPQSDESKLRIAFNEQQAKVGYPIYYPKDLPDGFAVETNTIRTSQQFVTFQIQTEAGARIVVIQQPRPPKPIQATKIDTIETTIGTAYTADIGGRTSGIVETKTTLISISSADQVSSDTLKRMLATFDKL